jgi:ferredoxin
MKITLDRSLCSGHARCNAAAPEIYELDDDGYCAIDTLDVPAALESAATRGAEACPERAIKIMQE